MKILWRILRIITVKHAGQGKRGIPQANSLLNKYNLT